MKLIGLLGEIEPEMLIQCYISELHVSPFFLIRSDPTHRKLDRTRPDPTDAKRTPASIRR